jgi:ubiquinone/menaquinone biosynthesis C-methylase UbiE
VLKLDVEGAAVMALRGARGLLESDRISAALIEVMLAPLSEDVTGEESLPRRPAGEQSPRSAAAGPELDCPGSVRAPTDSYFDQSAEGYYHRNYETPRTRHAFNLSLRRTLCLSLLDLGCGPGAMTLPLLERGRRVVAYDLAPAMVREARRLAARAASENAAFCVGDASRLPFADASFAAIMCTGVLEYVPDAAAALREARRVLAPGGQLVATMSLPRRLERLAARALVRLRGGRIEDQPPQFIHSRASFDGMVAAAGLRLEARRHAYFAPFPLDVLWPRGVPILDQRLGPWLERVDTLRDAAKTYVVAARR